MTKLHSKALYYDKAVESAMSRSSAGTSAAKKLTV